MPSRSEPPLPPLPLGALASSEVRSAEAKAEAPTRSGEHASSRSASAAGEQTMLRRTLMLVRRRLASGEEGATVPSARPAPIAAPPSVDTREVLAPAPAPLAAAERVPRTE